ncbi:hypothetical protein PR202_ga08553 [Eleusine coracana subsp. coracana]|uniref:Uncharacterized protein n=1 Tax=Eleusine coracana subsp. coracana TaxID=191504 RepID=A0AAV5C1Q3_ELECO|nr:hypothetical protein PR202_ga08553 [Eleusine coracana subsp. coracana]
MLRGPCHGFGNSQPTMSYHRATIEQQVKKVAERPACHGTAMQYNNNHSQLAHHGGGAEYNHVYEVYEEEYETCEETYEVHESSFEEEEVVTARWASAVRRGC